MFKFIVFLVISVTACYGDTTPKPVYCGETPKNVLSCLKTPQLLSAEVTTKCHNDRFTECEIMTCTFREYKWLLQDGSVDKPKVAAHFNDLAKTKPEWKTVIDAVVQNCVNQQLPAQGVHVNCPAYDIMHCALLNFIKKAPEAQWTSSTECTYPRQYAGACPVCPSDCFASLVPYGSCNACYATRT